MMINLFHVNLTFHNQICRDPVAEPKRAKEKVLSSVIEVCAQSHSDPDIGQGKHQGLTHELPGLPLIPEPQRAWTGGPYPCLSLRAAWRALTPHLRQDSKPDQGNEALWGRTQTTIFSSPLEEWNMQPGWEPLYFWLSRAANFIEKVSYPMQWLNLYRCSFLCHHSNPYCVFYRSLLCILQMMLLREVK